MPLTQHVSCLLGAAVMTAGLAAGATSVQAQALTWDWGGEKTVDGSGREVVRMAAARKPGDIIVSFSDRRLYFVTQPGVALSYPIAIPREQSRWQGTIAVTSKRENPSWTPTPTMRTENPKLPSWVPGGHPMNPLGNRALYLGSSTYRIHGTDAPWTIGSAVSKGCVRMYNQDVADLYPRVRVGASVLVTWDKFKAVADPDAKVSEAEGVAPERAARKPAEKAPGAAKTSRIQTGSLPAADASSDATDTSVEPGGEAVKPEVAQPKSRPSVRKRPPAPAMKKYVAPEEIST